MVTKPLALSVLAALAAMLAGCSTTMVPEQRMAGAGSTLGERVKQLSRGTVWRSVASIPAKFDTHHPQGMVKIGDMLFVSSVEITTPTKRFAQPRGRLRPRLPAPASGICSSST